MKEMNENDVFLKHFNQILNIFSKNEDFFRSDSVVFIEAVWKLLQIQSV